MPLQKGGLQMGKFSKMQHLMKMYGVRCVTKTRVERYSYRIVRHFPKLCDYMLEKRYIRNEKEILKFIPGLLEKYINASNDGNNIKPDCSIWIFWWTGFDDAPLIVKTCVTSVQEHSGAHKVVLLSKKNIFDYIELPDYIYKKFENGVISITHLSDIIRVTLLSKYGGIWVDATIYFTDGFDSNIYECKFYTNRRRNVNNDCVSQAKWSTYFLAGGENCLLFQYWRDFYFEYWKNADKLIDYLLMDYALDIGYRNIPEISKSIDAVPYNNESIKILYTLMNCAYNKMIYKCLIGNTYMHKLSWKDAYNAAVSGERTFYKVLFYDRQ